MTKHEFCQRFLKYMLTKVPDGWRDGDRSIVDYADEVAETYYFEESGRYTPEECVDIDMSYWEEG